MFLKRHGMTWLPQMLDLCMLAEALQQMHGERLFEDIQHISVLNTWLKLGQNIVNIIRYVESL